MKMKAIPGVFCRMLPPLNTEDIENGLHLLHFDGSD
jgi:hypothetical protein